MSMITKLVVFCLVSFFLASCNSESEVAGSTATTTTTLITPTGGTVSSKDGKLMLEIPAGALTSENTITIKKLAPDEIPAEFDGLGEGDFYEFGPDGMTFDVPVRLTFVSEEDPNKANGEVSSAIFLPVTDGGGPLDLLDAINLNIDGLAGNISISGELNHFSKIGLIEVVEEMETQAGTLRVLLQNIPAAAVEFDPFTAELVLTVSGSSVDSISGTYTDESVAPITFLTGDGSFDTNQSTGTLNETSSSIVYQCGKSGDGVVALNLQMSFIYGGDRFVNLLFPESLITAAVSISSPVQCIASSSGTASGAPWASVKDVNVVTAAGKVTEGGKTVTVTMDGPIPTNIHDDGFDRAHIELKFLRNGAPVTPGGLGFQKLDFFSNADAWSECTHLNSSASRFTPVNGDTCSISGDQITFAWDQPTNCFDRIEFYILAVGGVGGSSIANRDLTACP